ncbi:protein MICRORCHIDIA 6-like isoform X2 [Silene latifolia]|uniref:protein MICRORCHIDIA 6-like isoform X2 n=1 Tax=Silene latifolia TaxID=37657 RepID=UPI003D7773D6
MGEVSTNYVKSESQHNRSLIQSEKFNMSTLPPPGFDFCPRAQNFQDISGSTDYITYQRSINTWDERQYPTEDASASPICPAPLCRQFWKAGDYTDTFASKSRTQNSKSYMHIHPKFLHSNATSHKWAFGAIAELLDNAIDEIHNGSSFVILDKITNPRDGSPLLLIQDDGGGMDPEAIRRCMSFGFSDKESQSTIGKYGNGFKTGTMRLGADVIVFSRHVGNRTVTQSIGLLSYTYLSRTCQDRIIVPMVNYEYNMSTDTFEPLCQHGRESFQSNLSIILGWSPFTTIEELMKQFDDIGPHGTKVIVFNLWFTDEGKLEFDFESDPKDILLHGSKNTPKKSSKNFTSEKHIGSQYRYSLRVYMSILYLRIPPTFRILLRGVIVEHHSIARDLKYPEVIMYKPQTAGTKEGEVVTIIGFLKEAPDVNIHGFNVYHKNRLILVVMYDADRCRGRGVVGVLEANFIEPTHNKQDFERTSLFLKLEARLKDMTWEYWDQHCGLIGYLVRKKTRAPVSSLNSSYATTHQPMERTSSSGLGPTQQTGPVVSLPADPTIQEVQLNVQQHSNFHSLRADPTIQEVQLNIQQDGRKRARDDFLASLGRGRRQSRVNFDASYAGQSKEIQSIARASMEVTQQEALSLKRENKELIAKCLEHEKAEKELSYQVLRLSKDIEEARHEYLRMLNELQSIEVVDANMRMIEGSQGLL